LKGIILAGGTGSRLYPITKVTNKHLLPVGRYPMIFHAIYKLKQCDITDIMIVTGKDAIGDIVKFLGSGVEFGVALTYRVQEEAGGIAQALGICKDFINKNHMVVILADNVFSDNIKGYVEKFQQQKKGAKILLKQVDNPSRFGVPAIQNGQIIKIEEKPERPKSSYAVTGIYMYDANVFSMIEQLNPSERGELEVTDLNNCYLEQGLLTYDIITGWWTDAGTHSSLHQANILAQNVNYIE